MTVSEAKQIIESINVDVTGLTNLQQSRLLTSSPDSPFYFDLLTQTIRHLRLTQQMLFQKIEDAILP